MFNIHQLALIAFDNIKENTSKCLFCYGFVHKASFDACKGQKCVDQLIR